MSSLGVALALTVAHAQPTTDAATAAVALGATTGIGVALIQPSPQILLPATAAVGAASASLFAIPRVTEQHPLGGRHIATSSTIGAWYGWQTSRLVVNDPQSRVSAGLGLLTGEAAGLVYGTLSSPTYADESTYLRLMTNVAAGHFAVSSTLDIAGETRPISDRMYAGGELLGGTVAGSLSILQFRRAIPPPTVGRSVVTTSLGAWIGWWMPQLLNEDATAQVSEQALILGASAGYLTGSIPMLSPLEPRAATAAMAWAAASATTLAGLGGQLQPAGESTAEALGAITGAIAGAAVGPEVQARYPDSGTSRAGTSAFLAVGQMQAVITAGTVATYTTTHAVDDLSASRELSQVAYGVSAAASMSVPLKGPITPAGSAAAGSVGVWSAGLVGAASRLAPSPLPASTIAAAIAAEIGTLSSGLLLADTQSVSGRQVVWVDGMGLLGVGMGTLVSTVAKPTPQGRTAGALAGGALGLGLGLATANLPAIQKQSTPAVARWTIPSPKRFHAQLTPGPYTGDDGSSGASLLLTINEVRP